jgi:hypothetical protein
MLSLAARKHRADLAELARLAEGDLSFLFHDVVDADRVKESLIDVLPRLVAMYGAAAASLGADWYDELREQAEVRGRFQAIVADLPDVGRTDALAGWAVGPMTSGGLQRIIFDADRDTVTGSAIRDPRARGWQREGAGECDFCAMLIGRGAVYSEASVEFDAHDRCRCVGVPVFD